MGFIELPRQFLHRLLVERCLLAAEMAEGLDLGLIGKIRNNRFFRLQPPQNVRPYDLAKRSVWVVGSFREALDKARELLRRSEQTGIDKVKDRPQIPKPVLDRRAGERKSRLRV